jgi:hypothetical protein
MATGRPVTDSVHVLRVPALPDGQEAAVALDCDGEMIIYMREDHATATGAVVLQSAMDSARDVCRRARKFSTAPAS